MSETERKTKKTYIFALLTFMLVMLLLCGCSVPTATETIKEDVARQTGFTEILYEGLDIDEISIIKRNTDKKNKLDEIWVSVTGRTEDIYAVRNYKLTYMLYNDGWRFEKYETYQDQDNQDQTKSLTGVSLEDAQMCLEAWDLQSYASFSPVYDVEILFIDEAAFSLETGYCKFIAAVDFIYPILEESAEIPMLFEFVPTGGYDAGWTWNCTLGHIENRTLGVSDIEGTWSLSDLMSFDIKVTGGTMGGSPSGLENNGFYSLWWQEETICLIENINVRYECYDESGKTVLRWKTDEETGKLESPYLAWYKESYFENPIYIYPEGTNYSDTPVLYLRTDYSWGFCRKIESLES